MSGSSLGGHGRGRGRGRGRGGLGRGQGGRGRDRGGRGQKKLGGTRALYAAPELPTPGSSINNDITVGAAVMGSAAVAAMALIAYKRFQSKKKEHTAEEPLLSTATTATADA